MERSGSAADATVALPDHLLGAVIGLAGQEAGPSTTLVCRRWHRLFWEEGSAWRELTLDCSQLRPQDAPEAVNCWHAKQRRLLARVGRHVRVLTVCLMQGGSDPLHHHKAGQLLRLLAPTQLTSLTIDHCKSKMARTLRRFTCLEQLDIKCGRLTPEAAARLLLSLPRLCSLQLDMDRCDASLAASIARLPLLTKLTFTSEDFLVFSPAASLASLSELFLFLDSQVAGPTAAASLASLAPCPNLTWLRLHSYRQNFLEMLQELPALHRLQRLDVVCTAATSGSGPPLAPVQRQLSRFPALAVCQLMDPLGTMTGNGIQFGATVLTSLWYRVSGPEAARTLELEVRSALSELPSVQALLAALVPAGTRLVCLGLSDFRLPAAALQGCPALEQLSALKVCGCARDPSLSGALGMLLGRATRLTQLQLDGFFQLRDRLKELDLSDNQLGPTLPAALVSATALTRLVLDGNAKLALTEADVAGTLACMPRLRLLSLRRTSVSSSSTAAMEGSGSTADVTATLPYDLLGAVIGLAGQEARHSTTLVCRRWHRLFWEEGSAWRRVTIDFSGLRPQEEPEATERRLENKRRLLARVGRYVADITVRSIFRQGSLECRRRVEQLLCLLPPSRLTSLSLEHCTGEAAHVVQGFTCLEHLGIAGQPSAEAVAGLLSGLPQLRSVELRMEECNAPLAAAIVQLPRLTRLVLHGEGSLVFSPGTQLTGLVALSLYLGSGRAAAASLASLACSPNLTSLDPESHTLTMLAVLRRPPALPRLQRLALSDNTRTADRRPKLAAVQRELARLPALAACELLVNGACYTDSGMKVGHARLSKCGYCISGAGAARRMDLELEIGTYDGQLPLQALLAAAVPAGTHLAGLSLSCADLSAAALQPCPLLGQLQALQLTDCTGRPSPPAALNASLGSATQLTQLEVSSLYDEEPDWSFYWLLSAANSLTQLRRLTLCEQRLADLPEGSIWQGLEDLDLSYNHLGPSLPADLASATALTDIAFASQPAFPH
ncbi:hypothetical protein ABPG75_006819 [Micractinium tetrahymenae]